VSYPSPIEESEPTAKPTWRFVWSTHSWRGRRRRDGLDGLLPRYARGQGCGHGWLLPADLSFAVLTDSEYDENTVFPSGNTYETPPWGLDSGSSPWDAGMRPAPEPSSGPMLALGALGLAGLASLRRGA
jgi:MYXO-CTERM domain-containing protein